MPLLSTMDPWRAVALLCCALLSLSCCEAAGHLRAGAALRAPAVGGGDAGERQLAAAAVSEVLEGVGETLMKHSLDAARDAGHGLVLLVGDEDYYGRVGFRRVPPGKITMPGPVDPDRLLYPELKPGAFAATGGKMRRL